MIEIQATEQAKEGHADLLAILEELTRPTIGRMRAVGREVRRGIGENFLRQRAGDGAAWQPLAPRTIMQRARLGFGPRPILFRTGSYMRSFTEEFNPLHRQAMRSLPGGYQYEYGSDDYRVAYHEDDVSPRTIMPLRPVLFLTRRAQSEIGAVLDNEHNRLFAARGW